MTGLPRACLICGKRVVGGAARCPAHDGQRYRSPMACFICGKRGPKGYCPEHDPWGGNQPHAVREARQPWRAGYRRPSYRKGREAALARAAGRCEKCGRADLALETDHRVPLSTGRNAADYDRLNSPANLDVLCVVCHRLKTSRG